MPIHYDATTGMAGHAVPLQIFRVIGAAASDRGSVTVRVGTKAAIVEGRRRSGMPGLYGLSLGMLRRTVPRRSFTDPDAE